MSKGIFMWKYEPDKLLIVAFYFNDQIHDINTYIYVYTLS